MNLHAHRDRIVRALFVLVPAGVIGNIAFSAATTDRHAFLSLVHFSPWHVALAMLLGVVPWFTGSLRLSIWSRFLGNAIPYAALFRIALSAELGAAIAPPLIGGGAVKLGLLMQQGMAGGTAASIMMLEGLEDLVFFVIMVPVAVSLTSSWDLVPVPGMAGLRHPAFWIAAAIVVAVFVLLLLVLHTDRFPALRGRIRSWAREIAAAYGFILRQGKTRFLATFALTALQWICRYSIITVLLASLGLPAQPVLFPALQVILFALLTFVPTPGGAGGAEALFYHLYRSFIPGEAINVVTTGWRFLTFYFLLLLGALILLMPGRRHQRSMTLAAENGRSQP